jgi:hypothetical protein
MTTKRRRAKRGGAFTFHGAFGTKARAVAKEKKRKGAFIKIRLIRGRTRYIVMSPNK